MQYFYNNLIEILLILTIISVTSKKFVEPHKIRSASKIAPFGYKHFLYQIKIVDNNTGCTPHSDTEYLSINFAEGCKSLKGCLVFA